MFRKTLLFLMLCLWGFNQIKAQSTKKEYDKLIFLYIDEKYEKCANLGLRYTEDDKLRRDPIPYLYIAMSYFEISKDPTLVDKHPDALKYSQKYAYKYRKKDKSNAYTEKYSGFLTALKDSSNRKAQYYYRQELYRKAASQYKYIVRFAPEDPIMQLWQGICEIKARNVGEGERNLGLAMEKLDDNYLPDKEILWVTSAVFEEYSAYMASKGDYAGKRKGQQLAEKYKKFSPEEIEKQKKLQAERNKPKREVKSFETDKETVENQEVKIMGTSEKGDDAKMELQKIEEEQKKNNQPKREVKTFSSDEK